MAQQRWGLGRAASTAGRRQSGRRSVVPALLLAAGLCLPVAGVAEARDDAPEPPAQGLEAELRDRAGAGLVVERAGSDGTVSFLGGARALTPPDDGAPDAVARGFVDRYGAMFGADGSGSALVDDGSIETADGGAAVRFQQEIDGVPVLAGQLVVRVAGNGSVRSSAGEAVSDTAIDTTPTVAAADAAALAVALTERNDGIDSASLTATTPELWIYDPELIGAGGIPGARLVWRIDVRTPLGDVDRLVLVDAHTGTVALTFSQVHAADSQVCDNANVVRTSYAQATCPSATQTVVKSDSINLSANAEVVSAYTLSEAVQTYYSLLNRDSIDDAGMAVVSTVRFCITSCPYANAFWSGTQMVYGTSYASADDVVGHELTHGVTQYESGLLYYSESGAINESLSDVFGELFDQWYDGAADDDSAAAKWRMGEDLPIGAIRDMEDPTVFGDPDRMTSVNYWNNADDEYGVHINSGVNNKAAFLITDGGTFNGQTISGLGIAKTAFIYYEAQTSLLTAGSDYLDLGAALPQACTNLVGQHGITAGDCTSVTKAVAATEMDLDPTVVGGRLLADDCPSGQVRTSTLYSNNMEATSGWTFATTNALGAWGFTNESSQSGSLAMYAPDPAALSQASATMAAAVSVPNADTYVRFDHSFSFDKTGNYPSFAYWDGGVVRYSANGGAFASITGLSGLNAVNGYASTLRVVGNDNPLAGQSAFVGISPGYQQTRYDIGALAGQTIALQFLVSTDSSFSADGWAIDDVEIYTCGVASAPSAPTGVTATAGDGSASLTWTAPSSDGGSAITGYTVTPIRDGVPQSAVATGSTATTFTATSLTNGSTYTFTVAATNGNGTGTASAASNAVVPNPDGFVAVQPGRVFDTRPGQSPDALRVVPKVPITPSTPLDVDMSNLADRTPASGIGAVSINVAVTNTAAAGFITVYSCGERKLVASVNYSAGQTVSNAVIAPTSASGHVCFYSSATADVIVDINGWFPTGSGYTAVGPERVFDTRPGESPNALRSVPKVPVTPTTTLDVVMAGLPGGVTPASGLGAVSLNVAVTNPQTAGFITVFPCANRKLVASVNFVAGQTVSNAVIAPVSGDGHVCFYTSSPTDLVVDIIGWFPTGTSFNAVGPERVFDTRPGESTNALRSVPKVQVTPDVPLQVQMSSLPGGVTPSSGVGAVSLNVAVTNPAAAGFVTVYPCPTRPFVASVNYSAAQTVSNAVIAPVSADGFVCFYSSVATDIIVDINGWFPS